MAKATILSSALLLSCLAVNAESDLEFNYQLLARDWVDLPDSFCGSTEQSPIDLNGKYSPLATNFVPFIQLPTISGVSVINTGENINIDFEVDETRLEIYSPVNSSFTDLYGVYTGTGVSPATSTRESGNRNLRGSRSGSRSKSRSKSRSSSQDQEIEAKLVAKDESVEELIVEAASSKSGVETEANTGILGDIHWHVPSEHTVNGRLAAAEMHLVHFVLRPDDDSCQFNYKGEQACIVVVGILFDLVYDGADALQGNGNNHTDLLEFLTPLPAYGEESSEIEGSFDLNSVLPSGNNDIWTYRGSLTTPECNENVTWMVVQEPRPIGWSQWSELRNVIVNEELGELNARPPQPRNDRVVFEGTFQHKQGL